VKQILFCILANLFSFGSQSHCSFGFLCCPQHATNCRCVCCNCLKCYLIEKVRCAAQKFFSPPSTHRQKVNWTAVAELIAVGLLLQKTFAKLICVQAKRKANKGPQSNNKRITKCPIITIAAKTEPKPQFMWYHFAWTKNLLE